MSASGSLSEQDMVDKLSLGVQVLENEILKPIQRKLREVNINRSQCVALVTDYQAGLSVISEQLDSLVLLAHDHSKGCSYLQSYRHADERRSRFWLCLYSLAEVARCLETGAIYISSCAVPESHRALLKLNPLGGRSKGASLTVGNYRTLSLTSSFLLQEFLFYRDVVLVEIQYLCDIRNCDTGKGDPSYPTFEWCAEKSSLAVVNRKNYRHSSPGEHGLLQASSAERLADEDTVHLRGQLREAAMTTRWFSPSTSRVRRYKKAIASYLMQLLEESTAPDALPSQFEVNHKDIKEGTVLGSGTSGYVVACKWQGEDVVVKYVNGALEGEKNRENFEREVMILASLQHPNTVRIFGFGYKEQTGFIIMEKMEANLTSLIRKNRNGESVSTPFPLDVNLGVLLQIVEGMCYLREHKVMHRDLKPENILVNRPDLKSEPLERFYQVKLGDFGTSKFQLNSHYLTPKVGTLIYMAPEILATIGGAELNPGGYTWKADVHSFGILCSEILTGERPFSEFRSSSELLAAIHRGVRPSLPDSTPHSLKSLIEDCWHTNPEMRPDVWQIRERLWKCRGECTPLVRFVKDSCLTPPSSWQGFCTRLDRWQQKASSQSRRFSFWDGSVRKSYNPSYIMTAFSSRKGFEEEPRETQWAHAQWTMQALNVSPEVSNHEVHTPEVSNNRDLGDLIEQARRKAEIARLRELNTLKGHVESIVRMKNLDINMIQMSYSV